MSRLDPVRQAALDALFEPFRRSDAPGLVVGVALGGCPIYRRAFGLASVQHGIANLPGTRMRIASISKQFTSLACLLLAEDGKLDIDAPASSYLPELKAFDKGPTLRHFMHHTSGYRCTLEMGTVANALASQPTDWQLRALARQSDLNFLPGHGHTYCNGTYHALSEIIERASGVSYEAFLKERVFDPLHMHDTESVRNSGQMVAGMAALHVRSSDGGWQMAPAEAELRGDGGIVSSVDDMLRWLRHLNGPKRVGNANTWRQLLTPATLANGSATTYALGIKRHRYRGLEVLHHSGGLIGLHAQLLTIPEHGLDVVIMVNGAPASATQLSWRIADLLLAENLGPARVPARAKGFEHLIGRTYANDSGVTLSFDSAAAREELLVSLFHLPHAPLFHDEGTVLRAGFEDIGLGPYVISKADLAPGPDRRAPQRIDVSIGGYIERLDLLQSNVPDVTSIVDIVEGHYFCEDLQAEADIRNGDSLALYLRGDYSARRRLDLSALSPSRFVAIETAPNEGRHGITFEVHEGQATGFWIDTYRARRLHFKRRHPASRSS